MSSFIDSTPVFANTLSVTEVNATIKACIDAPIFKGLEVYGEVSGFKYSGQHAYFTLKDKDSQLSCVCFYAAKTYNPKDGESVIVKGSLDYYLKGGRLSLQVTSIQAVGKGLLWLQFERLKAQLEKEGLFDPAKKKPIPKFAKNVLVVTSKTGAVIRDIVTTIRRKNPIINITVKDVRVQGDVGKDIANVLKKVDNLGYDVIIIARGGGSLEDLAPFYDETLCRQVFLMKTPVISAVGHETDFSLCDFVADARAATPTAAGELVAYDYYKMRDELIEDINRLSLLAKRNYERATSKAQLMFSRIQNLASTFYNSRLMRVDRALQSMKTSTLMKIDLLDMRVKNSIDSLDRLSPLKILSRGYFRLQRGDDTINCVSSLKVGDSIKATGSDGTITATISDIDLKKE